MPRYLLLLRDNDPAAFANLSPAQMQAVIQRYGQWSKGLGDRLVTGDKLTDEGGAVMARQGGKITVTDGPFGETKEVVGGIHVIRADSLAAAMELCKNHPQLDYGTVELREIEEFNRP
jgi:hypothetical protein